MIPLIIGLLLSVVPVVAKILEKIVATQLGTYLEQNNLLHPVGNPLKIFCY